MLDTYRITRRVGQEQESVVCLTNIFRTGCATPSRSWSKRLLLRRHNRIFSTRSTRADRSARMRPNRKRGTYEKTTIRRQRSHSG